MKMLEGKVGIITGGGSGIGREAAVLFAKNGAKVVVCGRREGLLQETVTLVKKAGGEAYHYSCDLRVEENVKNMVDYAVEKLGKLDFAFNNHGITNPAPGKFVHEIPAGVVEDLMTTNAISYYYCMKYEIPHLLANGGGNIVNTCSGNSIGATKAGFAYTASKYAVYGMTTAAALDYADRNIRVNGVGPGVTMTPMIENALAGAPEKIKGLVATIPDGRMGKPIEQAQTAMFLLSDYATHITGQLLMVDGGQAAKM